MEPSRRSSGQLWGAQTDLAVGNFPIAHRPLDVRVAHALAAIKRHAATVNATLDVPGVDAAVADAVGAAARRIEDGELDDQFPIDVYQTGSGTSTNMNVNEVIATLASEALGTAVHPNDHVNASQSSNDTVPTAIRIGLARLLVADVHPAVEALIEAFREMSARFAHVVKAGRTHLMDATPVTLGQEADAWAGDARRGARAVACRHRRAGRAAARRHCRRHRHQRPARVRTGRHRRAGRRDRPAAAPERQPDGAAGRAGRTRRRVGRAPGPRGRPDEDRQRHPAAGERPVRRARRARCCPSCRRGRRSCRARSTRCCASR